jgi:hypothetical protein
MSKHVTNIHAEGIHQLVSCTENGVLVSVSSAVAWRRIQVADTCMMLAWRCSRLLGLQRPHTVPTYSCPQTLGRHQRVSLLDQEADPTLAAARVSCCMQTPM